MDETIDTCTAELVVAKLVRLVSNVLTKIPCHCALVSNHHFVTRLLGSFLDQLELLGHSCEDRPCLEKAIGRGVRILIVVEVNRGSNLLESYCRHVFGHWWDAGIDCPIVIDGRHVDYLQVEDSVHKYHHVVRV